MSARGEPFVAWMTPRDAESPFVGFDSPTLRRRPSAIFDTPVVVTPLLPDDPRPGETWEWAGESVTIVGAPCGVQPVVPVAVQGGGIYVPRLANLRRPPVLKTYAFTVPDGDTRLVFPRHVRVTVQAESKDAALAKLSDALEEIP